MNKENQMGTQKMLPLLTSMALPPMLSMLIQSLYNIIDSIFVARLSESALSAVSIVYPLQNIVLSVAVGTGIGLNSFVSRKLGEQDKQSANNACLTGLILSFIHYVLIVIIGLLVLGPFVRSFTKSEDIYTMGVEYGAIILIFSFGQILHIAIEKIFQASGKMLIPMLLQGFGCIINIILDPILIFGLFGFPALGVKGAAIATIIGQIAAFSLALLALLKGKSGLKLHGFSHKFAWKNVVKQIYIVAFPSMLVMALPSLLVSGLNAILTQLSSVAVSVFGIYFKLQTFVYMPTSGLVQGLRPIMGYNYGAKNLDRQKDAIRLSMIIVGIIMAFGMVCFWILPEPILSIFHATSEMEKIGFPLLRIISIGFLPSCVSIIVCAVFESRGNGKISLILTLLRQIIIILPFSYLFAQTMGLNGVWLSFPIAEFCAAIASIILLKKEMRHEV